MPRPGISCSAASALGSAYRLFYEEPIRFVRGSGTTLYTADGMGYLDAYNNVPSVGHSHPRVVEAIARQAATLNTHTRYLQGGILDYAEDLLGTLPAEIENVMFTCTGSEANDLALRIATHATRGTGVIVTENADHGVTTEIAALSPSLGGIDSVADWLRVVPAPVDASVDFATAVNAGIASLEDAEIRPAALIVDTIFASDGVLPDPVGFADAVTAIRAAGGLFIADEVQPGFGRLGTGLWGFERHGLVPDIVTVGKPMGNGHPVAAVLAKRAPIEEFGREVRYFNTFGGNTVSIAAAQATLDVVRQEALVENARLRGEQLLAGLRAIGDPRIGTVRGLASSSASSCGMPRAPPTKPSPSALSTACASGTCCSAPRASATMCSKCDPHCRSAWRMPTACSRNSPQPCARFSIRP